MRFRPASNFLLPQSLRMRIFAVCFAGAHVPLIAFVVHQAFGGGVVWSDLAVLLIATVIGMAGAFYGIHVMLTPIRLSIEGVASIGRGERVELGPIAGPDEISQLLRRVNEAAASVHSRLSTLDHAAHRDPLTGMLNRRGFFAEVGPLFGAHIGGSFAIIDLDRFKQVNDRLGHAAGDQVLRDFANRIAVVCPHDVVAARWGGEEFVIYFPRTDEPTARGVLDRLLSSVLETPVVPPGQPPVTFSAGLVEAGSEPIERTAERADAALYAAKRTGRAQVLMERDLVARAAEE